MTVDGDIFDRNLLRRRRNRVADQAAGHAFLLAWVANDFADRLAITRRRFPVALNLGAHHGVLGRWLATVPGVECVIDAEPAALVVTIGLAPTAD